MRTIDQIWQEYHAEVIRSGANDNAITKMVFFAGALLLAKEAIDCGELTEDYLAREGRLHVKNCQLIAANATQHQN